jgi:hypothetical protein
LNTTRSWDASIYDIPRTEVGFEIALTAFIHTILSDDAYENLMVYLDQTIKPRSLTPPALVANCLRVLNRYSVALPTNTENPPELLTDDKLKAIYFRMMPISWQNSFRQAGKRMLTHSLASLSEYMQTLSSLDISSNRNGNRGQVSSDNSSYKSMKLICLFIIVALYEALLEQHGMHLFTIYQEQNKVSKQLCKLSSVHFSAMTLMII